MKKETISKIYKVVITVLTTLAAALGISSCMHGDVTGMLAATSCATAALILLA